MDWSKISKQASVLLERSTRLLHDASSPRRNSRSHATAPFSIQRTTANRKLAPQRRELARSGRIRLVPAGPFCVSTYVSIRATCPVDCQWHPDHNGGCYAASGMRHLGLDRIDAAAKRWTALDAIRAEADALDRLWPGGVPQDGGAGGRDLRLHVSGEVSCVEGALALGEAADRWRARGGGTVWTYTHRWSEIPRDAWGPAVEVFASVDQPAEIQDAVRAGYRPAVVLSESRVGTVDLGGSVRALVCPYEAGRGTTCIECRWCLEPHEETRAVAFLPHGTNKERVRLRVVRGST